MYVQDSDGDGDLECLFANDDFCALGSGGTVNVGAGGPSRYYLYVTGFGTQSGFATLEASCNP